ncbi:hypothetical protein ACK8P5_16535 [Paenibacillus sp. EC2-1]|uniref:hypothetical protein n=1 Tax=Paenibacillus sp. EC2-1 TaxID=3388665 RepID=UPI003BEEDA62
MTDIIKTETMDQPDAFYKELLTSTISEGYPKYLQENLLKSMEKRAVLLLKKRAKTPQNSNILDLSEVEETLDQISMAIENEEEAIKYFERNEFHKSYKYSAVFYVDNIDVDLINSLQEREEVIDFFDSEQYHDISSGDHRVTKPTNYFIGNVMMFKFSKVLTGFIPGSGVKKQIKYPIIGVYFKKMNVLEIRLDSTRPMFRQSELFYEEQINLVLDWFEENLKCNFRKINFPPIIEYIKTHKQNEVVVDAQSMCFKNGSKAVLENGINENYVLPLLGELKELIKVNQDTFDKSPEIKKLIETFITETETLSDLPWVTLVWKSDKTKVKFKFGATDDDYTILQYYGRQSDMEKMNDVTKYIIENQEELNQISESKSESVRELALDNRVV